MKEYYKQCKDIKSVNAFLKKLNLVGWEFDHDATWEMMFCKNYRNTADGVAEFDWDGWTNTEETHGASIQIHPSWEVFVSKYTKKDIEKLEAELN